MAYTANVRLILESILEVHREAINMLFDVLYRHVDRFEKIHSTNDAHRCKKAQPLPRRRNRLFCCRGLKKGFPSFRCDSITYGSLLLSLQVANFFPGKSAADFSLSTIEVALSAESVMAGSRDMSSITLDNDDNTWRLIIKA
jgi:hypothetical protein